MRQFERVLPIPLINFRNSRQKRKTPQKASRREVMPIYEYYCADCRKRVSVFFRTFSEASDEAARCPNCEGARLRRLVSRVAVLKSEESRLENLADPSMMAGLESEDPRALASFMRRMSDEMGEPLDAEMTEVLDRLEAGESPESIDASMPDMGGDGMDDGMDMGFGGMGGMDMGGMDMGGGDLDSGATGGDDF
jgi:putative FmdB family regulatory protein